MAALAALLAPILAAACLVSAAAEASCGMRRMGCPIPEEYVDANYAILGNESSTGACKAQGEGSNLYFEFGVDECNATVVVDEVSGQELYTVILVPNIALGGLVFVEWPDIACSCEVDVRGTVIAATVQVMDGSAPEEVVDNSTGAQIEVNTQQGGGGAGGSEELSPLLSLSPEDSAEAEVVPPDSFAQADDGAGFSVAASAGLALGACVACSGLASGLYIMRRTMQRRKAYQADPSSADAPPAAAAASAAAAAPAAPAAP